MDLVTAKYIIDHHSNLMTIKEKVALKHHLYVQQAADSPRMMDAMYQRNWLTRDPEILALLEEGIDNLNLQIARRILNDYPTRIIMNICPRCAKLARTSLARQCRHCYYSWHDRTVAKLRLKTCAQIRSNSFLLFGELISGRFEKGNYLDLTVIGINYQPRIKEFELALYKTENGISREDIGFPVDELPAEERAYLLQQATGNQTIDIITERNG